MKVEWVREEEDTKTGSMHHTPRNSFAITTAATASVTTAALGVCFSFDLDLNIYKGKKKGEAGHECIFSFTHSLASLASHETNDIQ